MIDLKLSRITQGTRRDDGSAHLEEAPASSPALSGDPASGRAANGREQIRMALRRANQHVPALLESHEKHWAW